MAMRPRAADQRDELAAPHGPPTKRDEGASLHSTTPSTVMNRAKTLGVPCLRMYSVTKVRPTRASCGGRRARHLHPLHRHDPRFRHAQRYRRRTGSARCYCRSQRCADILRSMSARGSTVFLSSWAVARSRFGLSSLLLVESKKKVRPPRGSGPASRWLRSRHPAQCSRCAPMR